MSIVWSIRANWRLCCQSSPHLRYSRLCTINSPLNNEYPVLHTPLYLYKLDGQWKHPIRLRSRLCPKQRPVAKRNVPTNNNTELQGLCHPCIHFSLPMDEPWITPLQRIGVAIGRITRSRCRWRHIRPWPKHVSSSVPAIAAAGWRKPKRWMVRW